MILVIDSSIREESRTKALAKYLIDKMKDNDIKWVKLSKMNLSPLDNEKLEYRESFIKKHSYDDPYFTMAMDLLNADKIVIIAPFYDLSFPSSLKCYLEHIMISGLVFNYDNGIPVGNLNASDLYYVTTSGGPIINNAYSYGYISDLFIHMLGAKKTHFISAEMLDIIGNDVEEIMNASKKKIDALF